MTPQQLERALAVSSFSLAFKHGALETLFLDWSFHQSVPILSRSFVLIALYRAIETFLYIRGTDVLRPALIAASALIVLSIAVALNFSPRLWPNRHAAVMRAFVLSAIAFLFAISLVYFVSLAATPLDDAAIFYNSAVLILASPSIARLRFASLPFTIVLVVATVITSMAAPSSRDKIVAHVVGVIVVALAFVVAANATWDYDAAERMHFRAMLKARQRRDEMTRLTKRYRALIFFSAPANGSQRRNKLN